MGITSDGKPYATANPFERPGPAPDRKDGDYQTKLFTTIDEAEAEDAKLRLLECSRKIREEIVSRYLPVEQRREDEPVVAREEADRRRIDFDTRAALKNERIGA